MKKRMTDRRSYAQTPDLPFIFVRSFPLTQTARWGMMEREKTV